MYFPMINILCYKKHLSCGMIKWAFDTPNVPVTTISVRSLFYYYQATNTRIEHKTNIIIVSFTGNHSLLAIQVLPRARLVDARPIRHVVVVHLYLTYDSRIPIKCSLITNDKMWWNFIFSLSTIFSVIFLLFQFIFSIPIYFLYSPYHPQLCILIHWDGPIRHRLFFFIPFFFSHV